MSSNFERIVVSELKTKLQSDMKEAMRSKDNFKRDVIRFLMSAIKQIEVDERRELSDEDIQKIIQKFLKQRDESATQFKEAGRDDLCEKEIAEAAILKEYMPKQLSDNELTSIIQDAIKKTGASSMKDMGKVMGITINQTAGKADGKRINSIVKELLS